MATQNAIDSEFPVLTLTVGEGGTSATTLLDHGVLVGSGVAAITALAVGGTGELLVGATGADPAFGTSAAGDFTFGGSASAATRQLEIENTDNTDTGSHANVNVSTGGSSAGDPTLKFTVASVTDWSTGIDNTDSDKWKISEGTALGTNDVLVITTAGEITQPLQPSFLVVNTAGASDVTGDATGYTLQFTSTIYDQGSDFDGTSTFTAPVSGCYFFSWAVSLSDLSAAHAGNLRLVTSNRSIFCPNDFVVGAVRDSSDDGQMWGSSYVDMDAADTATILIQLSGGAKVVDIVGAATSDPVTFLGGSLVC